jgi:hypothetical protein
MLAVQTPILAAPADDLVARIKAVRPEGGGNADAAKAWKELVSLGPDALPAILTGMEDNNLVVSNWLRTAADAVAEQAERGGKKLPADKLEKFLTERRNGAAARRVAYELLTRTDKTAPARLLPGMLQDPSRELRREAVAVVLKEAQGKLDNKDEAGAKAAFQRALAGACDEDQVRIIAEALKKLGVKVDLAKHYGFVLDWNLIAGFDNTDQTGYAKVYPPEKEADFKATYKGKDGKEVRWQPFHCDDPHGKVDLNLIIGKKKAVIAYACAIIDSPEERTVQVRAGSFNAIKLFVNGNQVFGRDEYHHGMYLDQHNATVKLKKGRNELLVKICQNDQPEDWAQSWIMQVRLCDGAGAAVPFTTTEVKP